MQDETLKGARILIVDDQEANVHLLRGLLQRTGYTNLCSTTDPRQTLTLFGENLPDLILLDLMMPHLNGFQVMELLKPLVAEDIYLPVLVLTADANPQARQRALAGGAKDFLTKPFNPTEVLLRIRNLLETRFLHVQLRNQNEILEARVRERTADLEQARIDIIERLAMAAEFRDDTTGKHTQRVGQSCALLAGALGLSEEMVELIRRAAPLHDVGKIAIPDLILLKADKLTAEEFELMKTHAMIGARLLSGSRFPLLRLAEAIAATHHERWDGAGYPNGLKGDAIPLEGRIVAVADAYDTMTNDRPYRKALSTEEAWEILRNGAGSQWDGAIVEAFAGVKLRPKGDADGPGDTPGSLHRQAVASRPRR